MVCGSLARHGIEAMSCAEEQGAPYPVPHGCHPAPDQPLATILLVDDEASLRKLLGKGLERGGFRVILASSGEEALEFFDREQGQISLLITDILMPGMSGCALAESILMRRPGLPVLFMSACAGDLVPQGAHFLQKPFSVPALLHEIAGMLHHHVSISSET